MKKFILAAAFFLMSLCFGDNLSAGNFGVFGGANFHTYYPKNISSQTLTEWNAGIVYKCNLPLGFQIHPTLMYNVKAATSETAKLDLSVGYLEFMASFQWGADLILFRPYVEVSPFVGYGMNEWGKNRAAWNQLDKLEYGVGLGGGLQIWRFQIGARYNWNFPELKAADFNGVTLSLTYFFSNRKQ